MSIKWIFVWILFLIAAAGIVFLSVRTDSSETPVPAPAPKPGSVSLEDEIAEKVTAHYGEKSEVIFIDTAANLAFTESKEGILPVLISEDHTKMVKMIHPILSFQEWGEEEEERGPIGWRAENKVQKGFSVISGFADDHARTIILNSEGDQVPSKFRIRKNLWVWYLTSKEPISLPVKLTVYDGKGSIIKGTGVQEE